jgi:hypothetical protein
MRTPKLGLLALAIFAILAACSPGKAELSERKTPAGYTHEQSAYLNRRTTADADIIARTVTEMRRQIRSQRDVWAAPYWPAPYPYPDWNGILWNQYWLAYRQQLAWNTQRIVARNQEEISRIISDSYWNRQRALDRINRRFSESILGSSRGHNGYGR